MFPGYVKVDYLYRHVFVKSYHIRTLIVVGTPEESS